MQTGHDGHVHIARAAAAAFGPKHHWQPVLVRHSQQTVGLLVVAHALGAGQHRGVVGQDRGRVPVDGGRSRDHAIRRRVGRQVFGAAAARLGGHRQRTVFAEAARVTQVGEVLSRRALAQGVALGPGLRPGGVFGQRQPGLQGCKVRARAWGGLRGLRSGFLRNFLSLFSRESTPAGRFMLPI